MRNREGSGMPAAPRKTGPRGSGRDAPSFGGLPKQPRFECCLQPCPAPGLEVRQAQDRLGLWNAECRGRQVTVGAMRLTWLQ